MKIRTPTHGGYNKKEKEPLTWQEKWGTTKGGGSFQKPMPILDGLDSKAKEARKRVPRGKKYSASSTYMAKPHTIWIREDIWTALDMYVKATKSTKRACTEEALYNFLLKEGRVEGVESLGEKEGEASWR